MHPSVRRLTISLVTTALAGLAGRSLAAQGLGASIGLGVHQRMEKGVGSEGPGLGAEVVGRWASRSGLGIGGGARLLVMPQGATRGSAFAELRLAPIPEPRRRLRPVVAARGGVFVGESDGDGSPLFGIEVAPLAGVALHAGRGVSLTALGELGMVVASNQRPGSARRLLPGFQVGLTLH